MIEFDGVTRAYGSKTAVDRLTLTVNRGELMALLGPNGAGKTTTIKMLVGLLRPDVGTIRVCGRCAVTDTYETAHCIGYVPDEPFLYDKLSGREFLEFVAQMRGLDRSTAKERIDRESDHFQLSGFLDELTETYSHGMKQRVVFAAALLHDPAVLVIDEPMVGLDPHSVRLVKNLLVARAAQGTTVFLSTHTLAMAEEIADRIAVVQRGRLHFLGTTTQLSEELSSPNTSLESLFLDLIDGSNGDSRGQDGTLLSKGEGHA